MDPRQEREPEEVPVIDLIPGRVTTGEWIASRGHWAVFACEVLPPQGVSDAALEIRAETRDADEPESAATEILPLRLDRGPWQTKGPGVHYAEFVRPRSMMRFRYCILPAAGKTSPTGPIAVRMQPARFCESPDGLAWLSPWIPLDPARKPPQFAVGRIDGPGIWVHFSAIQTTEAP